MAPKPEPSQAPSTARPLTEAERQAPGPPLLVTFAGFTRGGMAQLRVSQRGEAPVQTIAGTLRWTRGGEPAHGPAGRPLVARFHRTALPALVGAGASRVVSVGARRPEPGDESAPIDGALVELRAPSEPAAGP